MNDRIRLAEAIGWVKVDDYNNVWLAPDESRNSTETELPDPFTDANDDYAVLEWMRENFTHRQLCFGGWNENANKPLWRYKVGDYARAALRVLDDE